MENMIAVALGFALAVGLNYLLSRPGRSFLLDQPNARSLHQQPTPTGGGVGILAGLAAGSVPLCLSHALPPGLAWLVAAALLVAGVSFLDDYRPLPPLTRLAVHALAAGLLVYFGAYNLSVLALPGWQWAWPPLLGAGVSFLFVVWMLNLYNFMDGMDGFAGGMAVFGFNTFALLGLLAGNPLFAVLSILIAAAAAGFLLFNLPPARIFMGDTGASTLGFLAAAFALWASRDQLFPLWVAVLVFSPFIVDATVTLLRRLARGEKIWQAHRSHYYQRLVQLGWGHKKTLLYEYALMSGCSASALLAVHLPSLGQTALLLFWVGVYGGLAWLVAGLEQRAAV